MYMHSRDNKTGVASIRRITMLVTVLSLLLVGCEETSLNSIVVSSSGGGDGSITPASTTMKRGESTSFTVTPDYGYSINSISGCGGSLSGNTYTTGSVTGACTVIASFSLSSYAVNVTAGTGGTVNPGSISVNHGETTNFTMTPGYGYSINSVTGCGGSLSGNIYTTGIITGACTVSASFSLNSYTVSATASSGGTVSPSSISVNHGGTTSITVTPDNNYSIINVTGCGGSLTGNTYTTGSITGPCTVSASFADITAPTVSSTSPANGASGVTRFGPLTATFSEDMLGTSMNDSAISVNANGGAIAGSVSFDTTTNTLSFTPVSKLPLLTPVTATVNTSVTDLVGNAMTSPHSWSFTTGDRSWGSGNTVISSGYLPKIAVDSNGNTIVVLLGENVTANHYDGTKWLGATVIDELDSSVGGAHVAMGGNGNAVAVWKQTGNIHVNHYDGTKWLGARNMGPVDPLDDSGPHVAMDSNGKAIAVWHNNYEIFVSRYDGTAWSSATYIQGSGGYASFPQIVMNSNGNAVLVWTQVVSTGYGTYASHFDGTNWSSATRIDSNADTRHARIVMDNNGNAIVTWHSVGSTDSIYANNFDPVTSTWGTATLIENNTDTAYNAEIGMDSNGNVIAVWRQVDSNQVNSIHANRYDGTKWLAATLLEENMEGGAFPKIAVDSNGKAIVVWTEKIVISTPVYYSSRDALFAKHFDGTNWGSKIQIENNSGGVFGQVIGIAFDSNDNATVAWGQGGPVFVNRFD